MLNRDLLDAMEWQGEIARFGSKTDKRLFNTTARIYWADLIKAARAYQDLKEHYAAINEDGSELVRRGASPGEG